MPKMKTHSGAKKRFRRTGSGKIMRRGGSVRHMLEHKSSKRKRRQDRDMELSPNDRKRVKRLLGG